MKKTKKKVSDVSTNVSRRSVIRSERGWPGHYICVAQCVFRRNTLLECGRTRIVISTVGARTDRGENKHETIGHNRYYETMAFHAKREHGIYWDADVGRQVSFDSEWAVDKIDETTDKQANDMHEAVVDEITKGLEQGKRYGG